jgi:two-component system, response regulator, stage 0 sporulation protein A
MEDIKKVKIIIVDNSKDFCNIISKYLLRQNDMVVTGIANDGVEALKLIQEKKPDLVLLDMIMPNLDGCGFLKKLNTMDIEPMPRIIALSSVGLDKIIQSAMELGVEHYFVKPFDLNVFIETIRQMFKLQ